MREIILIRHGKTYGNTLGRYIGTTDEELCPEGREELAALRECGQYRSICPDLVYVSPLRRCRQTAEILFPGVPQEICRNLRECDFGEFENKNYKELSGNPAYQAWVDSGGTLPFPGGESREAFQERCRAEFARVLRARRKQAGSSAAFVVHGGTIMSILSAYAAPEGKLPGQTLPGQASSRQAPHWARITLTGVRSSWETSDVNCFSRLNTVSSSPSISSNVPARL